MRIRTITCHDVCNYGASLQAYALMTYLKDRGHDVKIIDYLPDYKPPRHSLTTFYNSGHAATVYKYAPWAKPLMAFWQNRGELRFQGRRKAFADAEHILTGNGLGVVVSDTGYVKTLPPDCILEQSPEPGKKVKSGRVVYVVINSSHSPMLAIPDIIDNCSYREARAKLIAMGFKVGTTEYISGEKEWLYGLKSNGKMLRNGQRVSVNDIIIMQVGDGMRDMNDSIVYAEPEDFYSEYGDSVLEPVPSDGVLYTAPEQEGDVDEFEVVTGPE